MDLKLRIKIIKRRIGNHRDKSIWLFGAWMGTRYSDNPKELFEYVSRNCPQIKAFWVSKSQEILDHISKLGFSSVQWGSDMHSKLLEKAGVVIYCIYEADVADLNEIWKVYDACKLHTSHGMPIKKAYMDAPNAKRPTKWQLKKDAFLTKIGYKGKIYNICTSDFFKSITYSQFMNKNILVLGTPRLDIMFSKKESSFISDLRKKFPDGVRFILYMPTFRSALDNGIPFSPFTQFGFDFMKMNDMLERQNMVFLNKAHFYDNNISDGLSSDRFVSIPNNPLLDIYDILKDVDILATDYSSIYTDFAIINKPIVLTPFDYNDYIKDFRGLYFDFSEWPSKIVYNWPEFIKAIDNNDYWTLPEERVKLFHKYTDANSCERIANTLIENLNI